MSSNKEIACAILVRFNLDGESDHAAIEDAITAALDTREAETLLGACRLLVKRGGQHRIDGWEQLADEDFRLAAIFEAAANTAKAAREGATGGKR